MATDIKSLVKQALNRQDSTDPQIRLKIYQSLRATFAKTIAKNRELSEDVVAVHARTLENIIGEIEGEFSTTESLASTVQAPEVTIQVSSAPAQENSAPNLQGDDDVKEKNHSQKESQLSSRYEEPVPQYIRPRRKSAKYMMWFVLFVVMAIIGWTAYIMTSEFLGAGQTSSANRLIDRNSDSVQGANFITILDPEQPNALITAGNGTAEITSETSYPAIRIMSIRPSNARDVQASPLLLELAPGVLKNIAGKKVTVEILAKSADAEAATFSVVCDFGELGACSRKRFRIGLQPERVIFSIQISPNYQEGQRAFLAINTDVTSAASLAGEGSKIDIIYARIDMKDST